MARSCGEMWRDEHPPGPRNDATIIRARNGGRAWSEEPPICCQPRLASWGSPLVVDIEHRVESAGVPSHLYSATPARSSTVGYTRHQAGPETPDRLLSRSSSVRAAEARGSRGRIPLNANPGRHSDFYQIHPTAHHQGLVLHSMVQNPAVTGQRPVTCKKLYLHACIFGVKVVYRSGRERGAPGKKPGPLRGLVCPPLSG